MEKVEKGDTVSINHCTYALNELYLHSLIKKYIESYMISDINIIGSLSVRVESRYNTASNFFIQRLFH